MMRPFTRTGALRAGAALVAATALPRAASAQGLKALTVGLTSKTASDWAVYICDKLGLFGKNGLKVDVIVVGSSAGCAQQLTAGSLDIAEVSTTQLIEAVIGGAPIVAVMNRTNNAPYAVVGKKGIASIAALRGKTVITGGPNDVTTVFMNTVLAAAKLKPEDVTYTFAGGTAERFAALMSGTVDAAILLPPFSFRATTAGYPLLDQVQKYYKTFPFDTFSVRSAWGKQNAESVSAYVRSILQAVRWLYEPANESQAIQILTEATNTAPDDAQKTYDFFVRQVKFYNPAGVMTTEAITTVLDVLQKANQIKPPLPATNRFYDNTYVAKAEADLRRR